MIGSPAQQHTLVSKLDKKQVLAILSSHTNDKDLDHHLPNPVFNGKITESGFRISLVITTPQNALPLAIGRVENTSLGSIVFLELKLFPAANIYLWLFTGLSLLIAGILFWLSQWQWASHIALLIGIANYWLLKVNFNRNARETLTKIESTLTKP